MLLRSFSDHNNGSRKFKIQDHVFSRRNHPRLMPDRDSQEHSLDEFVKFTRTVKFVDT